MNVKEAIAALGNEIGDDAPPAVKEAIGVLIESAFGNLERIAIALERLASPPADKPAGAPPA